jgi:hypothetical protein
LLIDFLSTSGAVGVARNEVIAAEIRDRLCSISKTCGSTSGIVRGLADTSDDDDILLRFADGLKVPERCGTGGKTGAVDQVVEYAKSVLDLQLISLCNCILWRLQCAGGNNVPCKYTL